MTQADETDQLSAMVSAQLEARGIRDPRVLDAFRGVPRRRFVPPDSAPDAYADRPVPIACRQTVSQPYIVAFMAESLSFSGTEKVLEIGTGSGYETAVLSRLAREVFSVEVEPELAAGAAKALRGLGAPNVRLRTGDGLLGWPEEAPFDRIVVSAALESVPDVLLDQLAVGGRFLGPVGPAARQVLVRVDRTPGGFSRTSLMPVMFIPAHTRAAGGRA